MGGEKVDGTSSGMVLHTGMDDGTSSALVFYRRVPPLEGYRWPQRVAAAARLGSRSSPLSKWKESHLLKPCLQKRGTRSVARNKRMEKEGGQKGRTDGWMGKWTDGRTEGWKDGRMEGKEEKKGKGERENGKEGRKEGRNKSDKGRKTGRQKKGRKEGKKEGRKDGYQNPPWHFSMIHAFRSEGFSISAWDPNSTRKGMTFVSMYFLVSLDIGLVGRFVSVKTVLKYPCRLNIFLPTFVFVLKYLYWLHILY